MNAMNTLVEQVLETSETYFAQMEVPAAAAGRPHLEPTETPTYSPGPGRNFPNRDIFTAVLDTYPEGIRELDSPLSD